MVVEAGLIEVLSGFSLALMVLLIVLFTSIILRSWRQELAVQTASLARKDQMLRLLHAQQRFNTRGR